MTDYYTQIDLYVERICNIITCDIIVERMNETSGNGEEESLEDKPTINFI